MSRFSRTLLYIDLLSVSGLGLFFPFLAVIIIDKIPGATLLHVGYAVAIYCAVKAISQLIITRYTQDPVTIKPQLLSLLIGSLIVTLVPLGYIFITSTTFLYVVQGLWGLGEALTAPAWFALFNKSLTQGTEGKTWAWRETVALLLTAIVAIGGGVVGSYQNYQLIFIAAAVVMAIAAFKTIQIYKRETNEAHLNIN